MWSETGSLDHDGLDMPSLDEARRTACATAAAMSTEDGGAPKEVEIRVRDGRGPAPVASVTRWVKSPGSVRRASNEKAIS